MKKYIWPALLHRAAKKCAIQIPRLLYTYDTSVDAVLVVGNALRRHSSNDEVTTIVLPRRQTTEVHYWYTRPHARACNLRSMAPILIFVPYAYYISRESKTTRNVLWSRASVCLSVRGRMPTLLHGPGCNLEEW